MYFKVYYVFSLFLVLDDHGLNGSSPLTASSRHFTLGGPLWLISGQSLLECILWDPGVRLSQN